MFIKAYQSRHQLRHDEDPFPWLVRIVINECRAFHRRTWREIVTAALPDGPRDSTEETVLGRARDGALHEAVLSLPEKYRVPIVLFYFEGLPTQTIARFLRTRDATIRTRLNRARGRLRGLLIVGEGVHDGPGITRRETGV